MATKINFRVLLTSMAVFASLLPCGLQAATPRLPTVRNDPVTVAEYRVVGVTTTLTNGAAQVHQANTDVIIIGYAAMTKLCQDEVDPYSRMATAAEWGSGHAPLPDVGTSGAWVDPGTPQLYFTPNSIHLNEWVGAIYKPSLEVIGFGDNASGVLQDMNCTGWFATRHLDSYSGVFGNTDGSIDKSLCNESKPIACSALVAIPVRH